MAEWLVSVEAVMEADSAEEAGQEFQEWLNSGRRSVLVKPLDGGFPEVEVEL